jgi:large subunit ribosomal protein L9
MDPRWPEAGRSDRARKVRAIRDRDHANEVKQTLESAPVRIVARAGEGGRLFGSITTADVAGAVKAAGGVVLDKRKVELAGPIKTLGKHKATVQLLPNVVATVAIEVVTE